VGTPLGTAVTGVYSLSEGAFEATDSSAFDAAARLAWQQAMAIRDDATNLASPAVIGGLIFTPGTYRAGTLMIPADTDVTLDGEGNETSTFLIQAETTMFVGSGANVILTGGAKAENVLWAAGTSFATEAGTSLKGSIMAGTAINLGANTVIDGSILALTAVTLGAMTQVNGCVVALTSITFGTMDSVTFGHEEEIADPGGLSAPASFIDFPELANGNDQLTIACMPRLEEETPAACDNDIIFDNMNTLLNDCTTVGIANALASDTFVERRTSRSDILQVEGEISMHTLASLDGEVRSLRGVGQEERRLRRRMCRTTSPSYRTILLCCFNTNAYSYCGSPTNTQRRELQTTTVVAPSSRRLNPIPAAQVEQYLPEISEACTSQFQALAQNYIDQDPAAECFASAADVPDLTCYAVMVTGGAN
jgi:hypothetical protein